jgi:hypothetical protein
MCEYGCSTTKDVTKFLCAIFRMRKQTDELKTVLANENAELVGIQFKFKDEELIRTVTFNK